MLIEDEIIEIEKIGERDTIDINVSGDRLFLANGILTHNSAVNETDINHSHIAGGLGKINTSDVSISIIFTESMKEVGDIVFKFTKTRNSDGVGKRVLLKWNAKYLRITDASKDDSIEQSKLKKEKPDVETEIDAVIKSEKVKREYTHPVATGGVMDLMDF